MRHGEQLIIFFCALLLLPVILLLCWPLMLYVRFIKPRTGVTIGLVVSNHWTDLLQYMRLPFDWALFRAGAKVKTINPKHLEAIESILNDVDGLILTGGEDINPSLHDGDDAKLVDVNEERDKLEMAILDIAERKAMPYLCVCRGAQLMALRAGGNIASHHYSDEQICNHISSLFKVAEHPVKLQSDSRILGILGTEEIIVNSFHHLLISDAGNANISAIANDNVIEAIEHDNSSFALGVQWHPEFMAPFNKTQQNLFNALVNYCADRKKESKYIG